MERGTRREREMEKERERMGKNALSRELVIEGCAFGLNKRQKALSGASAEFCSPGREKMLSKD